MKYKVGDRVRIKSLDWYNENKDEPGYIVCGERLFYPLMSKYCGNIFTISDVYSKFYQMYENRLNWTDEMIEGLVGDENTLKTQSDNMETETHRGYYTTDPETTSEGKKRGVVYFWDNDFADKVELDLSGRELIQEDGKWFVVKKKKEYPKTYEECCKIVNANPCIRLVYNLSDGQKYYHDEDNLYLYENFRRLKICRDAYWKIAGEEMGLGKPWEPDWSNKNELKYCIENRYDKGIHYDVLVHTQKVLAFPTAEMRDAFKENFDPDIEICKEFL